MSQQRNILMTAKATTQPEYVYFDVACCNTTKYVSNTFTKVVYKFRSAGVNNLSWGFGTRVSNTGDDCFTVQLIVNTTAIASRLRGSGYSYNCGSFANDIEYEYDGTNVKFNGVIMGSPGVGFPTCTHSLYIGAINNNGSITSSTTAFSGRFYRLTFYDANGIVYDFQPWKDSSNVMCIKEIVSGDLIYPYYGNFLEVDPNA